MKENDQDAETQTVVPGRKPYSTPRLTVHGRVADLTLTKGTSTADSATKSHSDRFAKQDFSPVDVHEVMRRVASLPIESWSYRYQSPEVRHIGPMAQDFAAAFGVGEDDRHIDLVDASGVALASIQALYAMLRERDAQLAALRDELDALKQRLGMAPRPCDA